MFKNIFLLFLCLFSLYVNAELSINKYNNDNYKKEDPEKIVKSLENDLKSEEFNSLNKQEKINILKKIIEIYVNIKRVPKIKDLTNKGISISSENIDIAFFNYYKAYSINGSDDRKIVQESVDILIKIFDTLKENNNESAKKIKFDSALLIADTYALYSNPVGAMEYYKKSEQYIYSDLNILDIKNSKLYLYNSLNLYELAIKEMDEINNLIETIKLDSDKKLYYKESIYQFYIYVYERMDKYKEAHNYAEKFMKLVENSKTPDDIIKSYYLIATTYSRLENFQKADEYYLKAEKLKDKYELNKPNYYSTLLYYSKIAYYKHKKDYKNTLIYLDKFKEEAGVTGVALDYSYVYKKMGDFKKSYEYYELYVNSLEKKVKEDELENYFINNERNRFTYLTEQYERLQNENNKKKAEIIEIKKQNKILDMNNILIKIIIFFSFIALLTYIYLYNKYKKLSITDGLTQVNNKRYINRNKDKYSQIIIFDIDFFKKINDTYGHLAGDYVLKECAKIAKEIVSNKGKMCRYGGEEFVILLNKKTDSKILAETIRSTIEKTTFNFENLNIKFTVSVGIAENLEKADEYLYKAKNNGRNQVVFN